MKPLGKVSIKWSQKFAYAVGLIVTDGSLSKDGRHISFTSKDVELIDNFQRALGTQYHVGKKARGSEKEKKYYVVQMGDVKLYSFLQKIGLMPNKSKVIGKIKIPAKYFFDFLRGHLDGDGTSYSYWDPRWKSSFMFYIVFASASKAHIDWLQQIIFRKIGLGGHITSSQKSSVYQLKYAKKEAIRLVKKIYPNDSVIALTRKRIKIQQAIEIDKKHTYAQVEKLVNSPA